jgi:transcriptional regulator with XRE-family HTH domain
VLSENLKRLRTQKGMTQRAAAEAAGIATNHLGHLETGRIQNPRGDVLLRLAKVFGTTVEQLLEGRRRRSA